jgi:hypothetical protein
MPVLLLLYINEIIYRLLNSDYKNLNGLKLNTY